MRLVLTIVMMATLLVLHGCTGLEPRQMEPEDPEGMSEWLVEGELELESDQADHQSWFTYQWINGEYELRLRPEAPRGENEAVIRGHFMQGPSSETVDADNDQARELAEAVRASLPLHHLGYWLRSLPATADASIEQQAPKPMAHIEERDWRMEYHEYMQVHDYLLPSDMTLKRDNTSVDLEMVRAETGYLTNPCALNNQGEDRDPASEQSKTRAEANEPNSNEDSDTDARALSPNEARKSDIVERLVPGQGKPPLPRWVDEGEFCAQLRKVHGEIPDPRVGLYGPDSMFWELQGPGIPGAMGAGRALLLQVAHPWITAAIDEHSETREDPVGRARRTFEHVLTMVYGSMPQVMHSANEVRNIHEEIEGEIPYEAGAFDQGSEYRANEVSAMIWVHATLWETLVHMYEHLDSNLTNEEKEQFYQETKLFAMLFGIPEKALPRTWDEFMEYNHAMWRSEQLEVTEAALQLKKDLFKPRSIWLIGPLWVQETVTAAHLPPQVREGFDMNYGWWRKFNHFWMSNGARVTNWVLPEGMSHNPIYHEAHARLEGERVGWYQRWLIDTLLGQPRLVN